LDPHRERPNRTIAGGKEGVRSWEKVRKKTAMEWESRQGGVSIRRSESVKKLVAQRARPSSAKKNRIKIKGV